jgi:hypothetical protein
MEYLTKFERIDNDKIQDYLRLNITEYDNLPICNAEHLKWKYFQNPDGVSDALHLYLGDQMVGRIVYLYRNFNVAGKTVKAASIVDLLIHPEHRELKKFLILMKDVKKVARVDFIYFIPNQNSLLLYEKVLKYSILNDMQAVAFPINFKNLLKMRFGISLIPFSSLLSFFFRLSVRRPKGFLKKAIDLPSDKVFEDFLKKTGILSENMSAQRSLKFLRWRFCRESKIGYKISFYYKDGVLIGYIVSRIQNYLGYNTLLLMDFLFDYTHAADKDLNEIRRDLIKEAYDGKCDLVFSILNLNSTHQRKFIKFPLLKVSKKILQQPLPLFVENLSTTEIASDIFINMADFDLF